jgi:hypothetical protein
LLCFRANGMVSQLEITSEMGFACGATVCG